MGFKVPVAILPDFFINPTSQNKETLTISSEVPVIIPATPIERLISKIHDVKSRFAGDATEIFLQIVA